MTNVVDRLRQEAFVKRALKPHARFLEDEAADEIGMLRAALYEVITNGEWTEGEQRGEWKITKEVYEKARDAIGHTPPVDGAAS